MSDTDTQLREYEERLEQIRWWRIALAVLMLLAVCSSVVLMVRMVC